MNKCMRDEQNADKQIKSHSVLYLDPFFVSPFLNTPKKKKKTMCSNKQTKYCIQTKSEKDSLFVGAIKTSKCVLYVEKKIIIKGLYEE